jgi:hypothetical protein
MKAIHWTTKDGKSAPLHELELSHLRNIIRFLKKKHDWLYARMSEVGMEADDSAPKTVCVMWLHVVLTEFSESRMPKSPTFELKGDIAQMMVDDALYEELYDYEER